MPFQCCEKEHEYKERTKTCEDVRKYRDVKIAMTEKRARKLIARPTVKQWKIYEKHLAAIKLKRLKSEIIWWNSFAK